MNAGRPQCRQLGPVRAPLAVAGLRGAAFSPRPTRAAFQTRTWAAPRPLAGMRGERHAGGDLRL